jgi:hypothetical protein
MEEKAGVCRLTTRAKGDSIGHKQGSAHRKYWEWMGMLMKTRAFHNKEKKMGGKSGTMYHRLYGVSSRTVQRNSCGRGNALFFITHMLATNYLLHDRYNRGTAFFISFNFNLNSHL